jgi:hypothetical protein
MKVVSALRNQFGGHATAAAQDEPAPGVTPDPSGAGGTPPAPTAPGG